MILRLTRHCMFPAVFCKLAVSSLASVSQFADSAKKSVSQHLEPHSI